MKKGIQLLVSLMLGCSLAAQSYDLTFNGTGKVFPPMPSWVMIYPSPDSEAHKIILEPTERFSCTPIAGPYSYTHHSMLWRFNSDGSVDTSFGTNGQAVAPYSDEIWYEEDNYYPVCDRLPDGKYLLAKYVPKKSHRASGWIEMVRYDSNGNLDTGFGVNGTKIVFITADNADNMNGWWDQTGA